MREQGSFICCVKAISMAKLLNSCETRDINSSSDSDSDSDSDKSLCEEEVEEDELREKVLVPRKIVSPALILKDATCSASDPPKVKHMDGLGGLTCSEFFTSVVADLGKEELMRHSPRGQEMCALIDCIEHLEASCVKDIASLLITQVNNCLVVQHKLPSVAQGAIYSAFHRMRMRNSIKEAWQLFIALNVPPAKQGDSDHALQLIMSRILKRLISNKASVGKTAPLFLSRPLTLFESNAIRYMAGYVAIKLLKRYRRGPKNNALKIKYKLFTHVLTRMKAEGQMGDPDSVTDYSTLWQELIDRGGLYNINDDAFHLIEGIELVVRNYLNIPTVQSTATIDLKKMVHENVLAVNTITTCWERLARDIPPKYEQYSIELLFTVVDLWITIRGHSFAKGWNMKFVKKSQKKGSTRQSLKPETK